jgi:hypothetical protein
MIGVIFQQTGIGNGVEEIVQGNFLFGHLLSGMLSDFELAGFGQGADLGNYFIGEIHWVEGLLFPGLTYTAELAIANFRYCLFPISNCLLKGGVRALSV